jgi:hypothetical protein
VDQVDLPQVGQGGVLGGAGAVLDGRACMGVALDAIDRIGAVALAGDDQVFDTPIPQDAQALDVVLDAITVDTGDFGGCDRSGRIEVEAPEADILFADLQGVGGVVHDTPFQLAA